MVVVCMCICVCGGCGWGWLVCVGVGVCGYVVVVGGWDRRWVCRGWCGWPAYVLKYILSNRCEFFFEL